MNQPGMPTYNLHNAGQQTFPPTLNNLQYPLNHTYSNPSSTHYCQAQRKSNLDFIPTKQVEHLTHISRKQHNHKQCE